ncbi:MAG: GNAT family N-acetyltransferase [Clostridia bacterium]|nr:GNAT family N-acetyltransferase [Clostridia bacterium]
MDTVEKTVEYHELIMTLDSFGDLKDYSLPDGYKFEFWNKYGDIESWIDIHLSTGEFASMSEAREIFHEFYDSFRDELTKRCFFIVDERGEKVATSTVSPANEFGYRCVVDWFAVRRDSQGRKLSKALLSRTVKLAKDLGYDKILLHTQTQSPVAVKLYLDFGFNPFILDDKRGWDIIRTFFEHPKLKDFQILDVKGIYDPLLVNVKNNLDRLHDDYFYSVWYIDNRNDVFVNEKGKFFEYKFFDNGKILKKV